jgi:drug/metabolite transporter (DMT)-like permease
MTPFHIFLAILVAVVWGIAFVATKLGLESFGALRLAGMGLVLLGLAVIVLPLERLAGRRPAP